MRRSLDGLISASALLVAAEVVDLVARDNPGAGVFFLPQPIVGAGERETEDKGLRT